MDKEDKVFLFKGAVWLICIFAVLNILSALASAS